MSHFDVFNGDADGLCALQQLRLAQPRDAVLVTGVKRAIDLLRRVDAGEGDTVTVLDVSLHRNRPALQALLGRGAGVEYFDHHYAGEVPAHPLLAAHLDAAPDVCTSVLVDRHLQGRHRRWAIAGAFGDNLPRTAATLAASLALDAEQVAQLRTLGESINYNAYGDSEADLLVPPARLALLLRPYEDPLAFAREQPLARELAARQAEDLAQALRLQPQWRLPGADGYVLPDAAWARRVQGVFANALGQRAPARAVAILRARSDGDYVASVRAPVGCPRGADTLCLRFGTGGGRAAAAGIDSLPPARVEEFVQALAAAFPAEAAT